MYPLQKIKDHYPIDSYLRNRGISIAETAKPSCCCPFHDDKNPSMSIRLDKQDWKCWVCNIGGTVIDLHMRFGNMTFKDAVSDLAKKAGIQDDHDGKRHIAATYEYKDEKGKLVMCVDRVEEGMSKKFSQYTVTDSGERKNGVEGVKKTLYRLESWAGESEIHLCEGEKCVKALEEVGYHATTNPGGSSSWIDAYAIYLRGKHINIWADNDEPGKKWINSVIKSLEGNVESLRIIKVPQPYNDVADIVLSQGLEIATDTIIDILGKTRRLPKGLDIPVLSASDMYSLYVQRVRDSSRSTVDLSKWLPSLRETIRPLLPGDLVVILSDTGVGKTTMLANIAYFHKPNPSLFFELELQADDMAERFLAMSNTRNGKHIEEDVLSGKDFSTESWKSIYVCPKSKITLEEMEDIIIKSELVIGSKPGLVLVDYIGLMSGGMGKRYERMSTIAEGLKVMAKTTNTVIVISSQIHRDKDRQDINLHDAKDSGSIEASAQLVIGAWRPDKEHINLKVLKCTKALSGHVINCTFNGDTQQIREKRI